MLYSSICNLQELDDMLREYDMKRDSVEIKTHPNGLRTQCGTENTWNRRQDTYRGGPHIRSLISIDFPAPEMEPESAHVVSAVSVP